MEAKKERNYGIDLLRLLCMYAVVFMHFMRHGLANGTDVGSVNYITGVFLQKIIYSALSIFALISGYAGYYSKGRSGKIKKAIQMWFQVFFYGAVIGTILFFATGAVDATTYAESFFPLATNQYWYFSAYFPVMILSPWLNDLIRSQTERGLRILVFTIITVFGILNLFMFMDSFTMNYGQSFVWLMSLYLMGASFNRLGTLEKISLKKWVPIAIISTLLMWVLTCFTNEGISNIMTEYTNVFVILQGIAYMAIFIRIRPQGVPQKFIRVFAPAAFGVYLISDNGIFRELYVKDKFTWVADYNVGIMVLLLIGIPLAVFIVCLLIDRIRMLLFKVLHIDNGLGRLGDFIERQIAKRIPG